MVQTTYSDKEHPYELDVKQAIMDNPKLFGNIGESRILSEKAISEFGVIADLLIFSKNKGVVGIEIKTEHDSTQRLNKQLKAYESLSTEVWVVVHDSVYEGVEKVLKAHHHDTVGVISYAIVGGEFVFGKVIEPGISHDFDVKHLLNILWKTELSYMLNKVAKLRVVGGEIRKTDRAKGIPRGAPKAVIVNMLIQRLGPLGAYQMVVDSVISGEHDPEKNLNVYSFTAPIPDERIEIVNVKRKRKG